VSAAVEKRTVGTQTAMTVLPTPILFHLDDPPQRSAVIPKHHPMDRRRPGPVWRFREERVGGK
jgi:hypothetical protein